jgi:hypothetical protein
MSIDESEASMPAHIFFEAYFFRGVMIIFGRRGALELKTPRAGKLIYSQSQTKLNQG